MTKRKTTEEFKKEVKELVDNEYTVLEQYKNADSKILMRHNKCGYEYKVRPSNFLYGQRCPRCYILNKTRTTEEFKNIVYSLVGNKFEVLGEYKNANTPILMKHNICGYEFKINPNSFLKSKKCPICENKTKKKTIEEFKKEVYDIHKDKYTILGEYVNNHTKILVRCNKCGYEWEVMPVSLLRNHGCPKCKYNNMRKTTEQFKQEVYDIHKNKYTVLGEYVNSNTKILIRCNRCGREWKVLPFNILHGHGCLSCNLKEVKNK